MTTPNAAPHAGTKIHQDTAALAMPKGRRVGRPGHAAAREYLLARLNEIGVEPFRGESHQLPFRIAPHPGAAAIDFTNLIGVIRGKNPHLDPILVGAHYDSVIDAPCADDNATAVAVTLAVAEQFAPGELERDLLIALFDSEEPPFFQSPAMGSTRFYEDHCGDLSFACVIIMDLIGHDVELMHPAAALMPSLKNLLFVLGAESARSLPGVVESVAHETQSLKVFPTLNRYIGDMSDHHAFRLGGEPFLFLSCGQGKYYHLPEDDLEWVNFDKVQRVFEFVAGLVRSIDRTTIERDPDDPAEFEIRMIKRVFGLPLPLILKALGTGPLRSRKDLDQLVGLLADGIGG